jgi:hypothetical protein
LLRGLCAARILGVLAKSEPEGAVSVKAEGGVMASERIAVGTLARALTSCEMAVIFVAIVVFVLSALAVQPAGQSAFMHWILGLLVVLPLLSARSWRSWLGLLCAAPVLAAAVIWSVSELVQCRHAVHERRLAT